MLAIIQIPKYLDEWLKSLGIQNNRFYREFANFYKEIYIKGNT